MEPPLEYLQEDLTRLDERVPADALYMLQSIRLIILKFTFINSVCFRDHK